MYAKPHLLIAQAMKNTAVGGNKKKTSISPKLIGQGSERKGEGKDSSKNSYVWDSLRAFHLDGGPEVREVPADGAAGFKVFTPSRTTGPPRQVVEDRKRKEDDEARLRDSYDRYDEKFAKYHADATEYDGGASAECDGGAYAGEEEAEVSVPGNVADQWPVEEDDGQELLVDVMKPNKRGAKKQADKEQLDRYRLATGGKYECKSCYKTNAACGSLFHDHIQRVQHKQRVRSAFTWLDERILRKLPISLVEHVILKKKNAQRKQHGRLYAMFTRYFLRGMWKSRF